MTADVQPAKVKCLIVDDLAENRLALSALLRGDDVELFEAKSGAEALELLLVHEFALALLDVQMPEMDGFDLAELMRGTERTSSVPIIFVTAGAHDEHRVFKGYELGAVDFLHKPVEPRVLLSKAKVFFALQRHKQLEASRYAELSSTLRVNEMFAAILGHDLRNPLSAVLTTAQLLERRNESEAVVRSALRIQSSARRMGRMIDDLLDLSRARLGEGIPVDLQSVDLGEVLRPVVQEHQTMVPERQLELRAEGPLGCRCDADRISQVASNLIGNALTHGAPGAPIELHLDGTKRDGVQLTVKNSGEIPPDVRGVLFDPFRRGRGGDGLGLGLYIVEQIIRSHRGKITIESGSGETRFVINLPR